MNVHHGIAIVLVSVGIAIGQGIVEAKAGYEYSRVIGSYWSLSDKSSTLVQKTVYLDRYVSALLNGQFAPNDATIFPTPDNSFEQNIVALLSLQKRMHEIQDMDASSFAYQTAIQQITQQEQGEAKELTSTFEGCWFLRNHPMLWGWHDALVWVAISLCFIFGVLVIIGTWDDL